MVAARGMHAAKRAVLNGRRVPDASLVPRSTRMPRTVQHAASPRYWQTGPSMPLTVTMVLYGYVPDFCQACPELLLDHAPWPSLFVHM